MRRSEIASSSLHPHFIPSRFLQSELQFARNLINKSIFFYIDFYDLQNCSINILTPCIECRYDGAGGWRGPEGGSPADTNSDSGTVAQFVFVGPCGRFIVVEFLHQN